MINQAEIVTDMRAKIDKLTTQYLFLKRDRNQPLSEDVLAEMAAIERQVLNKVDRLIDNLPAGRLGFDLEYWFEALRMHYGPIEYFTVPAKCFSCGESIVKQNRAGFIKSSWITGCRSCHRSLCD